MNVCGCMRVLASCSTICAISDFSVLNAAGAMYADREQVMIVPARPIARNGLASAAWLMPSDCQAVISLSDDERLQAITAPKSNETGRVMTAMLGMRHSSNF